MGRHLAKRRSRLAGRRLARLVSNPAGYVQDLTAAVGPGLAAYAGARLLHRIAFVLVSKKWPHLAKHAGVVASVATFASTWFLGHKVKALAKFHTPIVIGTGIAAVQGLVHTYVPRLGWIMGDVDPDQYISKLPLATPVPPEEFESAGLLEPMGDGEYIEVDSIDTSQARPGDVPIDRDPGGEELDGLDPDELGSLGGTNSIEEEGGVFAVN